jgi:hypothetical protein
MTPEDLATAFPKLYHMTASTNWPSIQRFGLFSTSALLDRFEVQADQRQQITDRIRHSSVTLNHDTFGEVEIRDQKPLTERGLSTSLRDGLQPAEWLQRLNSLVFFWTKRDRLERLLNAREYRNTAHVILEIDTLALVSRYCERVVLSTMNTGSTQRSHPRGKSTFRPLSDFPLSDRRRVVELCIGDSVPDVLNWTSAAVEVPRRDRDTR